MGRPSRWVGGLVAASAAAVLATSFSACSSDPESEQGPPVARRGQAVISDGEATGVFGQLGAFDTGQFNKGGRSADSLSTPTALELVSDGRLFVADTNNNRALAFPAGSTTASAVYGQPDFSSGDSNNGGVSAKSLDKPQGIAFWAGDGTDAGAGAGLFVSDTGNNRVLFYPEGSTTASAVYGQGDFSSAAASSGQSGLSSPMGLAIEDDGDLYVADRLNHRVLFFPAGTTSATRVYGQGGSFSTTQANKGGISADSLNAPAGVAIDPAGGLYIADTTNRRVLHYSGTSTTADRVYGQSDFDTTGSGVAANRFSWPQGLAATAGELWVSDTFNNRVLGFEGTATTASLVLGQLGAFDTNNANKGGLSAESASSPSDVAVAADNTVFVADSNNHRVLSFAESCSTVGCDDGNPCTDDVCESDGTCSHDIAATPPDGCNGYACNPATEACFTTCSGDADCASPHVCRQGRCTRTCTTGDECLGGAPCADGWCCDSACTGECQDCAQAGSEGTCISAAENTDPQGVCLGYGCTPFGSCDSKVCPDSSDCSDGFECIASVCTRECQSSADCNGGSCVDGACCSSDSCDEGETCNFSPTLRGTCWLANGSACSDGSECGSGQCADGVCCDTACDGTCAACNLTGSEGTCTLISAGEDPDDECPTSAPVCGGFCDGAGSCSLTPAGTPCAEKQCINGELFEPAECDGTGSACPLGEGTPCPGGFGCTEDGSACKTSCETAADCPDGTTCLGGACRTVTVTPCTSDSECPTNNCVDGYCCNTACTGLCRSCAVSGQEGLCTPIAAGNDPDNECGETGDNCGGECDGAGECAPTPAGTECAPQQCLDQRRLAQPALCPGEGGECGTPIAISCVPGSCRAGDCTLDCRASSDCTDGAECQDGTCAFPNRDPSGCSCSHGARRPAAPPTALGLALLLGLALRRRREHSEV